MQLLCQLLLRPMILLLSLFAKKKPWSFYASKAKIMVEMMGVKVHSAKDIRICI